MIPRVGEIDVDSDEYMCWHELGHVFSAISRGCTFQMIQIMDEGAVGRARARIENNPSESRYIAAGGFAAEYILYREGHLDILEDVF